MPNINPKSHIQKQCLVMGEIPSHSNVVSKSVHWTPFFVKADCTLCPLKLEKVYEIVRGLATVTLKDDFIITFQATTRLSQTLRPSVRPGRRWWGSDPRQNGLYRSQGGFTRHCAIDNPEKTREGRIC
ncbi:hypothetical protein PoB_005766300 [Plakobranchus ocellatus]|uniref:Uncharacterized protein n=1 Tax=Plakobranchus ocellatus TaxID=259542 RepID=A0AAV4CHW8_9GAST|nr:hypothetical protein PoB_005766300 [Plakobranchus ocellatus]